MFHKNWKYVQILSLYTMCVSGSNVKRNSRTLTDSLTDYLNTIGVYYYMIDNWIFPITKIENMFKILSLSLSLSLYSLFETSVFSSWLIRETEPDFWDVYLLLCKMRVAATS